MHEPALTIESCRPIEEHARQVMEWRNDPSTLSMFFHHTPKKWDTFWAEFQQSYFSDPELHPVFVLRGSRRVAFLRFNRVPSSSAGNRVTCDISINVAPDQRGLGLGTRSLTIAKDHLANHGIDDVIAEVRKENAASASAFLKAGYRKLGETKKHIPDTGETAAIERFMLEITARQIGEDEVFIIAEAGSNWRMGTPARDLAMGKALIEVAVESGANAVKFQTYRPETVYVENAGRSDYLKEAGIETDIRDIFSDLAMPYELAAKLSEYSLECGVEFMTTPFSPADFKAVDPFVKKHKIASYEIRHPHLIRLAAQSGKPLILSTGASTEEDIDWAVNYFRDNGGSQLCLMQCTAKYPAPLETMNLRVIPWLKRRFSVVPGFSDHSREPLYAPLAAVALGARVIEKHYTMNNALPGPDHAFAITPDELKALVAGIRAVEKTLGSGIKEVLQVERELAAFARRGVQATRRIGKGDILVEGKNIAILRPGKQMLGVHPKHLSEIEGRKSSREIPLGAGIEEGDWS